MKASRKFKRMLAAGVALIGAAQILRTIGVEKRSSSARRNVMFGGAGALALGATAGAVASLLFAPSNGRQLRRDIMHKLGGLKDRGGDLIATKEEEDNAPEQEREVEPIDVSPLLHTH